MQLYGFFGIGARCLTGKFLSGQTNVNGKTVSFDPEFFFNYQWTPAGIKVGKTLSGFAEPGIGYKDLTMQVFVTNFQRNQ